MAEHRRARALVHDLPLDRNCTVVAARSMPGVVRYVPGTIRAKLALSEIVSIRPIFQSAIRLSMNLERRQHVVGRGERSFGADARTGQVAPNS